MEDLPNDLSQAIDHALVILSWQENLPKEEMPPRWMWHLDWELKTWFEEVDLARKAKYGGQSDDRDTAPMEKNNDPSIKERFGR